MITEMLELLSTSDYQDPTLLLDNVLGKYDVPPSPSYVGLSIEIYSSDDRNTEIVVNWAEELISVYGVVS